MSRFRISRLRDKLVSHHRPDDPDDEAKAAVAAVLRPGRDGVEGAEILLIKRADREGDPWSGHLAFPGGKRERSDPSLKATSIRETEEEVGLVLPPTSFIARLDDVGARTNGFRVAEYVFALDDAKVTLTPNAEVKDTLWVSLEQLAQAQGKDTMNWDIEGQTIVLPCVKLGDYVLWGMTHRMVMQLLTAAQ